MALESNLQEQMMSFSFDICTSSHSPLSPLLPAMETTLPIAKAQKNSPCLWTVGTCQSVLEASAQGSLGSSKQTPAQLPIRVRFYSHKPDAV